jgi:two-component system, sensor histidine kinase ChiS
LKDIPFIFLSAKTSLNEKLDGLARGAVDFITKPFSFEELRAKIKSIIAFRDAQKEVNIHEFEKRISHVLRRNTGTNLDHILDTYDLTFKEREVIILLCQGLQYKEISDKVCISLSAVRKRIHSIYQKLNVQNKTELILALETKRNE